MSVRHEFPSPDRFVAGSIGEVEDRIYVLQVREDRRLLTVVCDPMQIEALANHVERVLDEVRTATHGLVPGFPPALENPSDLDPLDVPLEQDFTVATLAIGWNGMDQALQLEIFSDAGAPPQTAESGLTGEEMAEREAERADEMAAIRLDARQGREFVARARVVLAADLPPCPLCAQPVRPSGHVCPRRNGYLGRSAWQPGSGGAG